MLAVSARNKCVVVTMTKAQCSSRYWAWHLHMVISSLRLNEAVPEQRGWLCWWLHLSYHIFSRMLGLLLFPPFYCPLLARRLLLPLKFLNGYFNLHLLWANDVQIILKHLNLIPETKVLEVTPFCLDLTLTPLCVVHFSTAITTSVLYLGLPTALTMARGITKITVEYITKTIAWRCHWGLEPGLLGTSDPGTQLFYHKESSVPRSLCAWSMIY